jgi:hypothetical protein
LVQHLQSGLFRKLRISKPQRQRRNVDFTLNFPTSQAIYDDLIFSLTALPFLRLTTTRQPLPPSRLQRVDGQLAVGYRSQG